MSFVVLIVGQARFVPALTPEIWGAGMDAIAQSVKDAERVKRVEEAEAVSAAYEKRFRVLDCGTRIRRRVKRFDEKPRAIEVGRNLRGIGIVILQRIRDEENARSGAIEIQHIGRAIVQVARAARDE